MRTWNEKASGCMRKEDFKEHLLFAKKLQCNCGKMQKNLIMQEEMNDYAGV